MRTKVFWTGLVLATLLLCACGPIIGGMMTAGNGIGDFRVTSGNLETLRRGGKLAVIGPFDKTPEAFYICRGEDEAHFVSVFKQTGLFAAELGVPDRFPKQLPKIADWRGKSGAEIQQAFKLTAAPEFLLSGTILKRDMITVPAQGVVTNVAYRLDFLEIATGKTTTIEVQVKELFQDAIPTIVRELARKMGRS